MRLDLPGSLNTLLQVISVILFEQTPISRALQQKDDTSPPLTDSNHLTLINFQADRSESLSLRVWAYTQLESTDLYGAHAEGS
jgi:hypothetical protein